MKILLIFVFVLGSALVQGQVANQVFANDTTKGTQTKYFVGSKEAGIYQGIAGFVFTTAHDGATIYLDGCYTTNNWQPIDTLVVSGATLTSRKLSQSPPFYKNYRLRCVGNGGDTCYIQNVRYILKY